jgi:O-antigen/teichoic acid export membrane protein
LFSPVILLFLIPAMNLDWHALFRWAARPTYVRLWTFGKWMCLITPLESLWQRLDVLMLEWLGGPADVGIYSAAYMFMGVAALVGGTITAVVYPQMAKAHGRNDPAGFARHYVASITLLAYLGLPCVLGIAALGPQMLRVTLGGSYSAGIKLFPWLALYGAAFVLQMSTGAVFFAIGRPQLTFYWNCFLIVFGVAGNIIFIPRWRAEGAAAVLAASTVLGAILSWTAVAACIGAWPDFKRIGLLCLSAAVMYLVVRTIPVPFSGAIDLFVRAGVGAAVYYALTRVACGRVFALALNPVGT